MSADDDFLPFTRPTLDEDTIQGVVEVLQGQFSGSVHGASVPLLVVPPCWTGAMKTA